MDEPGIPANAFIDPRGENRAAVERLLERALHDVIDHAARATERAPLPHTTIPADWLRTPEEPLAEDELLQRLRTVLDGCMNAAHPGYTAHMDPIASTASIIGALATGAVNNNMLSVELSPVFSQIEDHLIHELTDLFGLGPEAGGMMIGGGTLANTQALAVARNTILGVKDSGIWNLGRRPVVFASEVAHTSIQKAAMLLGLGTQGVHTLHTNGDSRIDLDSLHEEIGNSRARGEAPFAIVAIAGTTTTGNIDHLPEIADIAREHGLWLHIDAAYGGTLMFSDSACERLRGIERADSITFNPQKWLYVTKVCATVLFRRAAHLTESFRTPLPYMSEEDLINSGEVCLQGTRHPDGLKLWLTLQHIGRRGLGQLVDRGLALGERFLAEVKRRPHLQLASQPDMNIICFRARPEGVPEGDLDALNASLRDRIHERARVYLSLPWHRGHRWLRAVLINPHMDEKTIESVFAELDAALNTV